ncbi:rhodanese-like domain-containing protein [Aciduricibacillus chroicocephali]|uniref:Rhodanese-like domain-containing protein n=1 Tax=Aciduricibacillus chroicocephali TaxID=3054939 RepID=A0ABY9KWX6_9BACI|nr:rhodanese-like domain-containing protein [Bacillaceae bacterium 44XB]
MIFLVLIGVLVIVFVYQTFFMNKNIRNIPAEQLDNLIRDKKDKQLIDVRNPGEFASGHVKGFQNIPLNDLPKYLDTMPRDKEIIVMCESGSRSNKACSLLNRSGFEKITNVQGGMSKYRKSK